MQAIDQALQTTFRNPFHRAVVNILYSSQWIQDRQQAIFAAQGLSGAHFNLLRIARGRHPEPVSPGEIKERMIDKNPDVTRLADKLCNKELILRQTCPDNRRKVCITITEKGIEVVRAIEEELFRQIETIRTLSDEEATQLSLLLDKIHG